MTWLVPKLNRRVQLLKPTQTPNEDGGLDLVFGQPYGSGFESEGFDFLAPMLTVWMGVVPIGVGGKYVRGEQVMENTTHEFVCRARAVSNLGHEFSTAFNSGFKYMNDLNPLKSDYFLFMQKPSSVKGRLFRIQNVVNANERDEYMVILAEEIEERGTGYPS